MNTNLPPRIEVQIGGYGRERVFEVSARTRFSEPDLVNLLIEQEVAAQRGRLANRIRRDIPIGDRNYDRLPPILVLTDPDYQGQGTVVKIYAPQDLSEYHHDMARQAERERPPKPISKPKPITASEKAALSSTLPPPKPRKKRR